MRVLHAAKYYPPVRGGMETIVRDLAEGTAGDWDVTVMAAHDRRGTVEERRGGVRVVRVSSLGAIHSVPICPLFPFHLWRSRSDCVVLHEPNPVAGSALFLRTPSPRLVICSSLLLARPIGIRLQVRDLAHLIGAPTIARLITRLGNFEPVG